MRWSSPSAFRITFKVLACICIHIYYVHTSTAQKLSVTWRWLFWSMRNRKARPHSHTRTKYNAYCSHFTINMETKFCFSFEERKSEFSPPEPYRHHHHRTHIPPPLVFPREWRELTKTTEKLLYMREKFVFPLFYQLDCAHYESLFWERKRNDSVWFWLKWLLFQHSHTKYESSGLLGIGNDLPSISHICARSKHEK